MASAAVNNYITKRYDRWLDYSSYHCNLAGIPEEAIDVQNEVLCSLLQKDSGQLERLLQSKKEGYTELDFFVLRMIKLNACSLTSPYRSRYRSLPSDANVDYTRLDIEDVVEEQEDRTEEVLNNMRKVREVYDSMDLSKFARRVFDFHFFEESPFSEWEGPESLKDLYEVYNGVMELFKKRINGQLLL